MLTLDNNPEKATKLTTKENELLALLCAHSNEILQRDYALKTIWIDDNYFNARSMDVTSLSCVSILKPDPQIEISISMVRVINSSFQTSSKNFIL